MADSSWQLLQVQIKTLEGYEADLPPTSRYKRSTQIQDNCARGASQSNGLMRRAPDIVPLGSQLLGKQQPWISSQVEYREHQALVPRDIVGIIVDRPTTSNIWWSLRANRRVQPRHHFPLQEK